MENKLAPFEYNGQGYYPKKYYYRGRQHMLTFVWGSSSFITYELKDCFVNLPNIELEFPDTVCCEIDHSEVYFKLYAITIDKRRLQYKRHIVIYHHSHAHIFSQLSQHHNDANLLLSFASRPVPYRPVPSWKKRCDIGWRKRCRIGWRKRS